MSSLSLSSKPQRDLWLDILKGIGILCVVVGHITYNQALGRAIFLFHMPLFFLVGGWLHRVETPLRQYARKRAFNLLLPYGAYLLMLWPLEVWIAHPGQLWDIAWILQQIVRPMLFGGQLLNGFAAVFWFVTCYFLTQLAAHFFLRTFSALVCTLIAMAMLVGAYLNSWMFPDYWVLWNANTVLFTVPLYLIGYWAHQHFVSTQAWQNGLKIFLIVILSVLLLKLFGIQNNTLDLKYVKYGIPMVTLISALACVGLLSWFARHLKETHAGRFLAYIGGASITIMFLHQFVQLMMAKKIGITQTVPRITIALLICLLMHEFLKRTTLTQRLFLGSESRQTARSSSDFLLSRGLS